MTSITFNINSGKYWIGDPCYILNEQVYDEMIGNIGENEFDYQYEVNGHTITVLHTDHGDGSYLSDRGYISVDSGQIAAIPFDLIADQPEAMLQLGVFETLLAGEAYNDNGELRFSGFSVFTAWEEEEEAEPEETYEPEEYDEAEGF